MMLLPTTEQLAKSFDLALRNELETWQYEHVVKLNREDATNQHERIRK